MRKVKVYCTSASEEVFLDDHRLARAYHMIAVRNSRDSEVSDAETIARLFDETVERAQAILDGKLCPNKKLRDIIGVDPISMTRTFTEVVTKPVDGLRFRDPSDNTLQPF